MKEIIKEFSVTLNDSLINDFRDVVNDEGFAYHYFANKDGRNQFNPICSCMDWITVAVRSISNFPELSEDIDVKAMQVYSLISSIDIVTEAVGQLHRIIMNDPKRKDKWPFKDSTHIFVEKSSYLSDRNDDDYFKEIRAIFGAHPTKLEKGSERMFASWPHYHAFNENDFTVSIYSNKPESDNIIFGIKIKELLEYLKERYEYLSVLGKVLQDLKKKHYKMLSKRPIPPTDNIKDELRVLLSEVEVRGNNDYYRMELGDLKHMFEGDVKEPHLMDETRAFKDMLYPAVAEIRTNLQKMKLVDLTAKGKVMFSGLPGYNLGYELQKIFTWLHSDRYDPLSNYYLERLNKFSDGRYCFNAVDSDSTTLLKIHMMLYRYQ
ncbi:hypothetical protein MXM41_07435 [Leclercia adecarboxylata]|uniref:hypothetical protein n=1 Tax=Leclercia adecarboxylata TaxID=83655 RepID=UPI002DBA7776|nr:hypothetical protein [Leclercia adecarboxylata]MEB6378764.1 hypothetical protein [Leclercia adecarboxylata]